MVEEFSRSRAKDLETHALLVQRFDFQLECGFMLTLKWTPTASNSIADVILRPSRDTIIRLQPDAFQRMYEELGPLSIDLMASTASVQCILWSARALPFFSQHDYAGSSGVDMLGQNVSRIPGTGEQEFEYRTVLSAEYGRVHRAVLGGVSGVRSYYGPRYECVRVPTSVAGNGLFFGSSSEGYVWVLRVASPAWNTSRMTISQMGDESVRSGLSDIGRMILFFF